MTLDWQAILTGALSALTILAGVYATRSARKANEESTAITGFKSLVESLQKEVADHNTEIDSMKSRLRDSNQRIDKLEHKEQVFTRWARSVIRWYEDARVYLRDHPIDPLPEPPPGIEPTDD